MSLLSVKNVVLGRRRSIGRGLSECLRRSMHSAVPYQRALNAADVAAVTAAR